MSEKEEENISSGLKTPQQTLRTTPYSDENQMMPQNGGQEALLNGNLSQEVDAAVFQTSQLQGQVVIYLKS